LALGSRETRAGQELRAKSQEHFCAVVLLLLCPLALCAADRTEPLPNELQGAELIEKPDAQLPLELEFLDETGAKVALGSFFQQKRPVLMALVYFECPMLCTPLLNSMIESMKQITLTPGKDYEVVIVSFDPLEGPALAAKKKANLVEAYERVGAAQGFHLLTGEKTAIARLTSAMGFGYKWVERDRMYAHPATLYVCTPSGRISRYLKGMVYEPATLRMALVEAGQGKIGTVTDQIAGICYDFDPSKGKYTMSALKVMRIGGILTLLFLGVIVLVFRGMRKRRLKLAEAGA
jgi:protein SCO1/2